MADGGIASFFVLPVLQRGSYGVGAFAQTDFEQEPINYYTAPVNDAVQRLQSAIESGETHVGLGSEEPAG